MWKVQLRAIAHIQTIKPFAKVGGAKMNVYNTRFCEAYEEIFSACDVKEIGHKMRYIQNIFFFQKLFVEAPDPPSAEEQEDLGQNLCIVCQMMPISRALIPCGHACLCVMCFDKMNTCPMCRQVITSSFILR